MSGCDADEMACHCGRRCPGSIAKPGSQKRPSASSDTPAVAQLGTTGLMIVGAIGMVLGISRLQFYSVDKPIRVFPSSLTSARIYSVRSNEKPNHPPHGLLGLAPWRAAILQDVRSKTFDIGDRRLVMGNNHADSPQPAE